MLDILLIQNFQQNSFGITKIRFGLRQNGHTIGRSFYIHPNSGELYYLILLLNHQKGLTSYESLQTVNNIIYPTNQTTCHALSLLGDDKEWDESIEEASF